MRPILKTVLAFLIGAALLSFTGHSAPGQTNQPIGLPADIQTTLESADTFTLFSIDPTPAFEGKATNTFQGRIILGQLDVQSRGTRMELIDALNQGISAGKSVALCFNPRHGMRARKGDETVELLICFECGQIYVTSHSATSQLFMTTTNPASIFNRVLKEAGIPVVGQDAVYYVGGEVAQPGPENYSGGTTVTAAIQAAGGFTPFASHKVWLYRAGGTRVRVDVDKALKDDTRDPLVYPGDQIKVPRRIF